ARWPFLDSPPTTRHTRPGCASSCPGAGGKDNTNNMAGPQKIFDTETAKATRKQQDFSGDVVGRFRSGYQVDNRPQSLGAWRVTTGDPEVAARVHELFGGDSPQEWDAKGEDILEVFTAAAEVDVILEGASAIRQRMVLRNMNGEVIRAGDGETL